MQVFCIIIAGLASLAVLKSGFDVVVKVLILILVPLYTWVSLKHYRASDYCYFEWHSAGHWRLVGCTGDEYSAELVAVRRFAVLFVLTLRVISGSRFRLLLLPDNLDSDLRRQLRIRLLRNPISTSENLDIQRS